jgi:uncharacterized membrane protein
MIAYLDASVAWRVLFGETNPSELWGKWQKASSTSLWDRLRLIQNITVIEVADLVATSRPSTPPWKYIRSVTESFSAQSTHSPMSSAIFIRESQPIDLFLTHDSQLGTAARSLGFRVAGTE